MARPRKQEKAPQPPKTTAPEPRYDNRYIASSPVNTTLASWYGLPQTIDDAESQYGLSIYDKMLHDADIQGFINGIKAAVLESEPQVLACVEKPNRHIGIDPGHQKEYENALQVAEFVEHCQDMLSYTDRPLIEIFWDMLEAITHGHRLAEMTLRPESMGAYKGKFVLESISVKPRANYAFVADNQYRLLGVTGKIPGKAPVIRQGIIGDPSNLPNFVPKEKLFIFSPWRRNGDPRGTSLLRGAYVPWKKDQIIHEEEVKFLSQFGGGMITATLPDKPPTGKYYHPVTGAEVAFSTYVGLMLQNLGSGQYGAFPFGVDVTIHQPSSDGKAFDLAFERNRREKALAIVTSVRAFLEAKHGSKADSDSADDTFLRLIQVIRQSLCDSYRLSVVYQLVRMNFGQEWATKYLPRIEATTGTSANFAEVAKGLSDLGVAPPEQSKKILFEEKTGTEWVDDPVPPNTDSEESEEDQTETRD